MSFYPKTDSSKPTKMDVIARVYLNGGWLHVNVAVPNMFDSGEIPVSFLGKVSFFDPFILKMKHCRGLGPHADKLKIGEGTLCEVEINILDELMACEEWYGS